jgi:hypothetical protein
MMNITFGEAAFKRAALQKQIAEKRESFAIALQAAEKYMTHSEYQTFVADMNAGRVQIALYADGMVLTRT